MLGDGVAATLFEGIVENMKIKRRTEGFGLKRPGDGVAATLFEGIWDNFFGGGEGYPQF